MLLMPGNHCSEHIKEAIESIVNAKHFTFDKSKIVGVSSDEGYTPQIDKTNLVFLARFKI